MSERRKTDVFVRIEDCTSRHERLVETVGAAKAKLDTIEHAIIGNPYDSKDNGLVGKIEEIQKNSQSKYTGRDKAYIIGSFLLSIGSILAAIVAVIS